MSCHTDYITIDSSTPSRSGLYAVNLPGVELAQLAALTKTDQSDYNEFWSMVYNRAWQNLISDITDELKSRFFIDAKLITRETSKFQETSNSGGVSGVRIHFSLPKYARLHVISAEVYSEQAYDSPDLVINFNEEDQNGELLHSVSSEIVPGRNTINVDTDFEVSNLFVSYDSSSFSLRKTENKYYPDSYNEGFLFDKLSCTFKCEFGIGSVQQISGGGINVKYVVYCSIERFVCENINIFKQAFYWKIANEILVELIFGNNVNCFTAITPDRAKELMDFYGPQYQAKLDTSVNGLNIYEDPFCFNCKNTVTSKPIIP